MPEPTLHSEYDRAERMLRRAVAAEAEVERLTKERDAYKRSATKTADGFWKLHDEVERLRENEQRLVEWLTAIDFPSGFSTTIPAPGFLLPLLARHLAVEGVTVEEATAWLEDDQDFDDGAAR